MDTNKEIIFNDLLEFAQQIRDYMSGRYEAKHLRMKQVLVVTAVVSACLVEDLADQMKTITIDEVRKDFIKVFNSYFHKKTNHTSIVIERDGKKHRLCKDKSDNMPDTCTDCSLVLQCRTTSPICCEIADQFNLRGFYHFELKDKEHENIMQSVNK